MNTGDNAGQGGYVTPPQGGQAQPPPQPTTPLPGYPPTGGQAYYDPGAAQQTQRINSDYGNAPSGSAGYGQYTGQATTQQVPPQAQVPPQQTYPGYTGYDSRAARAAARADRAANRQNRVPIVGPLLLITAGVIFLLNSLDLLDWGIWGSIWRLWPLVLVIIGIDMLVGRRSPILSLLLVIIVIGAGAAFLYAAGGLIGGSREQFSLNVPLNSAKAANVQIDIGAGDLTVDSGEGGNVLATGTLGYYSRSGQPSQSVNTSGDTLELDLNQSSRGGPIFFGDSNGSLNWNIHLNPQTSTRLIVKTGAGHTSLELEKLHLTNLTLNSGVGSSDVTLPSQANGLNATINGGVGSLNIEVPAGVEARIKVNSGLGSVNVDSRFSKIDDQTYQSSNYNDSNNKLNLSLNAGVGSVNITSR